MSNNKLILGTVQFGLPYGINNISGQISTETVFSILDEAAKNNVAYLDTAAAYGNSEEIIGKYLASNTDSKFKIITKLSFSENKTCEKSLLESLTKLQINFVDTIMFHSYADYCGQKSNIKSFLDNHKSKSFVNLGVSVYTSEEIDLIVNDGNVDIVQLPYNLLDNNVLRYTSLLKLKQSGKIVHARSAFLQGLFVKDTNAFPTSLADLKTPIQNLKNIAAENKISIQKMAFSYAYNNPLIDNILIGVDNLPQFKENLSFIDYKLNQDTVFKIELIKIENESLINPSKWKI